MRSFDRTSLQIILVPIENNIECSFLYFFKEKKKTSKKKDSEMIARMRGGGH